MITKRGEGGGGGEWFVRRGAGTGQRGGYWVLWFDEGPSSGNKVILICLRKWALAFFVKGLCQMCG